jgi:hypothetical protein
MLIVFPVAFAIIITKGLRISEVVWYMIGLSIVMLSIFMLTISFIVFGILIISFVKKAAVKPDEYKTDVFGSFVNMRPGNLDTSDEED